VANRSIFGHVSVFSESLANIRIIADTGISDPSRFSTARPRYHND
jgi:hypothetical protein